MWKALRFIGFAVFVLPLLALRQFAWWLDGWTPKALRKAERWVGMWGKQ